MVQKVRNPEYEAAVRASFLRQGLMGTLGAWLVDVSPGSVTIEVPHAKKVTQQQGFFTVASPAPSRIQRAATLRCR